MEIRKIESTKYIAKISEHEISEIRSMLLDLSLGDLNGFDPTNNEMLFDKMLARRVAAEMYRRDVQFPDTGFVVVDTNIDGRNISFSIGNVPLETTVYRHSDVIYI